MYYYIVTLLLCYLLCLGSVVDERETYNPAELNAVKQYIDASFTEDMLGTYILLDDFAKVRALLDQDQNLLNKKLKSGLSPLMLALSIPQPMMIGLLLNKGAQFSDQTGLRDILVLLSHADKLQTEKALKIVLRALEQRKMLQRQTVSKALAFLIAQYSSDLDGQSRENYKKLILVLRRYGADVNYRTIFGETILTLAQEKKVPGEILTALTEKVETQRASLDDLD